MRTPFVAGNWKMNTTLADAHVLADGVRNGAEHLERIQIVLCPPSIWLSELAHHGIAPGLLPHLHLGAQNMYFEEKGAFTGEISPGMVSEVAEYVILGHSERTHIFKEDAQLVNQKVHAAFAHNLTPILCIGEDAQEEGSKKFLVHTIRHLTAGLSEGQMAKLVVAYEPVWAIGSGKAATAEYAQEMIGLLRGELTLDTHILYGGSVTEENAADFLNQPDIDGFLIGGTSLKLAPFLQVCAISEDIATRKPNFQV